MLGATILGVIGGLTYTFILLNPGFRFSKLAITPKDFFIALGNNAFLGGVAGFLGWALSAGEVQAPRSYAVYLLFGVGGGSLIQSLALSIANSQSKATLDRTLHVVESLSATQEQPAGEELRKLTRSLRDTTSPREQERLAVTMLALADKIRPEPEV